MQQSGIDTGNAPVNMGLSSRAPGIHNYHIYCMSGMSLHGSNVDGICIQVSFVLAGMLRLGAIVIVRSSRIAHLGRYVGADLSAVCRVSSSSGLS